MSATTTQPETQPGRKLYIADNLLSQHYTFSLRVEYGDWSADREVTVVDESVDIADLMRRIADRQFEDENGRITSNCDEVTILDNREGSIYYTEPNGRKYLVATWTTSDSGMFAPGEVASINFQRVDFESSAKSGGLETQEVEIGPDDLDDLVIERPQFENDNLIFPNS